MGDHINADGKFQSDKYPDCPAGKVPLSTSDPMAQDLLWEYARRREVVDAEFSEDLRACLIADGFKGTDDHNVTMTDAAYETLGENLPALVWCDACGLLMDAEKDQWGTDPEGNAFCSRCTDDPQEAFRCHVYQTSDSA